MGGERRMEREVGGRGGGRAAARDQMEEEAGRGKATSLGPTSLTPPPRPAPQRDPSPPAHRQPLSHWVLVEHDRQELVHGQHLGERPGSQQLAGAWQGDHVGQRPVRVIGLHQVPHAGHSLFGVLHLHPLPAHIAGVQDGGPVTFLPPAHPRMLTQRSTEPLSGPGGVGSNEEAGVTGQGESRPTGVWGRREERGLFLRAPGRIWSWGGCATGRRAELRWELLWVQRAVRQAGKVTDRVSSQE